SLQHFGRGFHGRNLPAEWVSTANKLEALAFEVKDSVLLVDDFVPPGASKAEAAKSHANADRFLRAQRSRRAKQRMGRPEKSRRGLIVSTGETTPRGKSIRAGTLIVLIKAGDVQVDKLTLAQRDGDAGTFAETTAGLAQWMAGKYDDVRQEFRDN